MTSPVCSHGKPFTVTCRLCMEEGLSRVEQAKAAKPPKQHKCAVKSCRALFVKSRPMQKVCSPECSHILAVQKRKAAEDKQERARRKETRERLQQHIRKPVLEQKARKALQELRRHEDIAAGHGCVSCDKPYDGYENRSAGHGWDGGHYRSVGSAAHMSLVPNNIWLQCVRCNDRLGGNHVEYRKRLVQRIGIEAVEALEADNEPRNYTRDELIQLAAHYRAKLRELKKGK